MGDIYYKDLAGYNRNYAIPAHSATLRGLGRMQKKVRNIPAKPKRVEKVAFSSFSFI
jgi:hypothetical protein